MSNDQNSSQDMISLISILENAGNELGRLTSMAEAIDDHVGDLLSDPNFSGGVSFTLLQDVDRLRQSIDCMRNLVFNIAGSGFTDKEVSVAAMSKNIYLQSMRSSCLTLNSTEKIPSSL